MTAALSGAVRLCVAVDLTDRLDRFLADQLALSRTQAARLIADKRVTSGGRPLRASATLERGTEIIVDGYQTKDHSLKRANGRDVTFTDGRKLFMGSSGTGAPLDGRDASEGGPPAK